MKILFQKSLRSSARVNENGILSAEAVLLSTDAEIVSRIEVAKNTLMIEKAEWESLRSGSHYVPSKGTAEQLIGHQAYFGISASLSRAFPEEKQAAPRALFAECVKAVIQAECYLYMERGFADQDAYQSDWDATHPNSCRYYSHLDLVKRRWYEYIGAENRTGNLFHRHKNVDIWCSNSGDVQATGSFLDSFHELGVRVTCAADGSNGQFAGGFLRAPDSICFGTAALLEKLSGGDLGRITRKDLNRCTGGPEGCAHLLDLVQEMVIDVQKTVKQFDAVNP